MENLSRIEIVDLAEVIKDIFEPLSLQTDISVFPKMTPRPGFSWFVPIMAGLTLNQTLGIARKNFPVVSVVDNNLDRWVTINDRDCSVPYLAIFKPQIEADEKFSLISADELKKTGVIGNTLLERLMLEIIFFALFSRHLDVEDNFTLCSGSRYSNGYTPVVSCIDEIVTVDWWGAGAKEKNLRTREVQIVAA